jgi:hypothetical protein
LFLQEHTEFKVQYWLMDANFQFPSWVNHIGEKKTIIKNAFDNLIEIVFLWYIFLDFFNIHFIKTCLEYF